MGLAVYGTAVGLSGAAVGTGLGATAGRLVGAEIEDDDSEE